MQSHPVIIKNRMGLARWGYVPEWKGGDDKAFAGKMINARAESAHQKPTFRDAWHRRRRCLIPANGFFEWHRDSQTGLNQPYYIHPKDQDLLAFAGLWSKIPGPDGPLVTFTILTKQAGGEIAKLHHRTPVILRPDQAKAWFEAENEQAHNLVQQASDTRLTCHTVSLDVGNVQNDHPELIREIAA